MDSPIVTRIFRELFRHPACRSRQNFSRLRQAAAASRHVPRLHHHHQRRHYAVKTRLVPGEKTNESAWTPRSDMFPLDRAAEFDTYETVTAEELKGRTTRPQKVKMLMRDFVDDSLYNPNYGYFSKNVVIFSPGDAFDFPSYANEPAFHAELSDRYTTFEDALDAAAPDGNRSDRPLWHTPTELFRPYYGEAIARYLVSNYRLTTYPYHDLIIYEMGAGRGTLMLNILDYIREMDPQVYARTQYRVIEISQSLAALQSRHLRESDSLDAAASSSSAAAAAVAASPHADHVEIINRSIFDWNEPVPSPCFFLGLEVFDNFAHDCLRYDLTTGEPLQSRVLIDDRGDFHEFYDPVLDPVAARFLRVRHAATAGRYPVPYTANRALRGLGSALKSNRLSSPEYIPTKLMLFFDVLEKYFPAHRLLTSDFHSLPDAVEGLNGPVVQTRYERRTVPTSTPLVHQGYFDIMFPTDFNTIECMYQAITGKLTRVSTHGDFMRRWAYLEDTQTRSGENPLLSYYSNASVMVTV
ncbi:S-adenosyl-L-methionine-dependent methyltransferase [Plectosphaerella cucumerina]|uniref:Protein arginine methyltransferase NDUFAF7 n=1 Tax=Plectosphaerella cucumerina TaxID=40658 RepID=A0A8K0X7N4_9PEZI|nr:S-adenosyl-L-methionine-dependent methyltransferase [Plectosphaerella cucumerina]